MTYSHPAGHARPQVRPAFGPGFRVKPVTHLPGTKPTQLFGESANWPKFSNGPTHGARHVVEPVGRP